MPNEIVKAGFAIGFIFIRTAVDNFVKRIQLKEKQKNSRVTSGNIYLRLFIIIFQIFGRRASKFLAFCQSFIYAYTHFKLIAT